MTVKPLYKFTEGTRTTYTLIEPDCEYTLMYRLIADAGMELVNGNQRVSVIDTDTLDGWTEEPAQEDDDVHDI